VAGNALHQRRGRVQVVPAKHGQQSGLAGAKIIDGDSHTGRGIEGDAVTVLREGNPRRTTLVE
jgi:hypothetical protein